MTEEENKNKPSRFAKHLAIMGIEDDATLSKDDLAMEIQAMDEIDLPPLDLPDPSKGLTPISWYRRPQMIVAGSALALAALVLLMINLPPKDAEPDWQVKGGAELFIYIESEGKAQLLGAEKSLPSDTPFRVQLLASQEGWAYLMIFNAQFSPLTNWEEALQQPIKTTAGQKADFPSAYQLDQVAESEVAVVLLCSDKLSEKDLSLQTKIISSLRKQTPSHANLPGGCKIYTRTLR